MQKKIIDYAKLMYMLKTLNTDSLMQHHNRLLKIATRKSPLAMQQALNVKQALLQHYPTWTIELLPMETAGDTQLSERLMAWGGKGLFVKELECALLNKRADIAVHSMKDVPAEQPDGLEMVAICLRDDPRDVFISIHYDQMMDLPLNAKIGTASLRRQCQLHALRSGLEIQILRGNVNTRLKRLADGDFDAIVLAAAGLKRLNLDTHIKQHFSIHQMLPAPGQGTIGIECRSDDNELKTQLQVLSDPTTAMCLAAERAMAQRLGGSCRAPIAAYCEKIGEQLSLRGLVGTPEGDILLFCHEKGDCTNPTELGLRAANALLSQGAQSILDTLKNASE